MAELTLKRRQAHSEFRVQELCYVCQVNNGRIRTVVGINSISENLQDGKYFSSAQSLANLLLRYLWPTLSQTTFERKDKSRC